MISLDGRVPQQTLDAIHLLVDHARQQMLLPIHLHLGFFNVRDVMKLSGPHISVPTPTGVRCIEGIPYHVVSLDDGIHLCCHRAGHPLGPIIRLRWTGIGGI